MPIQQVHKDASWTVLPILLLAAGLLVSAAGVLLTFGDPETRWIGHAVTGTVGLVLLTVVVVTGAVRMGRITNARIHPFHRYHRASGIWLLLFTVGTFVLGLLTTFGHGEEPLLESPHGLLGLVLVVLALLQVVPSLLVRKRLKIQMVHRIAGYATAPLYILQVVLGIYAAGILVFPAG